MITDLSSSTTDNALCKVIPDCPLSNLTDLAMLITHQSTLRVNALTTVSFSPMKKSSKFYILGPSIPQCLELDSSSSEGSTTSLSPPSTPSHVSACGQPTKGSSLVTAPLTSNHHDTTDWADYESPERELDTCERRPGSACDTPHDASDDESNGSESPVVLTPDRSKFQSISRPVFDFETITAMFDPSGIPSKRPSLAPLGKFPSARTSSSATIVPSTPTCDIHNSSYYGIPPSTNAQKDSCNCEACGRTINIKDAKKVLPCGDITCSSCFSSTLAAVSTTHGYSRCPACLEYIGTFQSVVPKDLFSPESPARSASQRAKLLSLSNQKSNKPMIMRIDNVGWDVTPNAVENFLPRNCLSCRSSQPVHILLDRFDGRTKDYIYIEVGSVQAAQNILKTRQNCFMSGGALTAGRKRAVTITPVAYVELIEELRPRSAQELHSLLSLCQAAVSPVSGSRSASRYIKSRHGPFYSLMSIMSKISGKNSPSYWDLFHVSSGAISALSKAISHQSHFSSYHELPIESSSLTSSPFRITIREEDIVVRDKLLMLFEKCFGIMPGAI
ncbi:uncharacterized protein L203_103448 [Cryptococcus depauperatus CBS 7841]|uniref:RING-type domain-containing protein n=1 Tax=Cryptococcus depauperatus CBS 7841 TaxID=1295531 RepID=A0AAJ8M234_9TREE